ncbi:MAG TPA: cytochrome c oxidase assembly protein [Steroidobacteraceae bacterium]|nr:cytochrome c oxidase assembly protein [Steroidobacteraceae bacterium]
MRQLLTYIEPWEFSPTVFLVCAGALVLYLRGLKAQRAHGGRVGFWQPLSFFIGLTLDYAVLQTYCDYLAQHMFWVHRLQHLILHHFAPVLIVLAAPGAVLIEGVPQRWRTRWARLLEEHPSVRRMLGAGGRVFRIVQHPLVAPLLFVGLIFYWLTPTVHFAAMLDIRRYRLMNWGMGVDGLLFWWLMLAPRRAQGRAAIGYPIRILIVCLMALPQILLGAYIALHSTVLFDVYGICGRAWAISPLTDQELGGLLTWIPAAMMSGVAMLVVLRRLLQEEGERTPPRSALTAPIADPRLI